MGKKESVENLEELTEPEETASETMEEPAAEAGEKEADPLEQKEREIRELKNEMLRLRADTDNFRKRLKKEKEDTIKYANERLFKDLVPIYDNLARALEAPEVNVESLKQGVEMIGKQFLDFMEKHHVQPIEAVGQKFDPNFHEVLSQVDSDQHEDGTVIDQYGKGYTLHGRVLIPAKVVTARNPSAPPPAGDKDKQSGDPAS